MALDKGLAALLRALGTVAYPDDYSDQDEARDFAATFLGEDPTGARLRTLGVILDAGGYFGTTDVRVLPHSADLLGHVEGRRVLCGEIVNRLVGHFAPPAAPAPPHDALSPQPLDECP